MGALSFWHIVVLVTVMVLLFGGNRISALLSDTGKGIKQFRSAMKEGEEK